MTKALFALDPQKGLRCLHVAADSALNAVIVIWGALGQTRLVCRFCGDEVRERTNPALEHVKGLN